MRSRFAIVLALVLLVTTVLVGQAVADSLAPAGRGAETGRTLGRAGFAYLTGVRTYVAAVLWNRVDPLFHDYYDGRALEEQTFMLPSIRAVVALDPDFDQPYFVAAWILAQRGAVDEAVDLAALGVSNNPDSGLLLVNHAQILFLFTEQADAAAEIAEGALAEGIYWRDLIEQHDSYATMRSILSLTGNDAAAARVSAEIRRIDEEIDRLGLDIEHDHDH